MPAYEVPLSAQPQFFNIKLGSTTYRVNLYWSNATGSWNIDLYDQTGTTPIITGIPLVTGTDLLAPYGYMNFGGQLVVQTDGDINAIPTYSNIGTSSHLYFVTP